jgi:hypothetical protein
MSAFGLGKALQVLALSYFDGHIEVHDSASRPRG